MLENSIVNFTQEAFQKLEGSLEPADVVRIRAAPGGCSGVTYSMEIEDDPLSGADMIFEMGAFKICVDPYSKFLLKDLVVDHVKTENGSGFKFGEEKDVVDTKDCCSIGCE